jgi:tetratricopeptide (TPR) repeat protein
VLSLGPLADAESHELLLSLLPADVERQDALLAAIVRRAGGVPLYLVSYAEEMSRRSDAGAHLDVPWTVAQVVRQRVVALPPRAQELLGAAAVAGRVVQTELLQQVTNHVEQDVLEALEAAFDAHLLNEEEGSYRFEHDLVRETIEQDLSAARRRFWHHRIGAALASRPGRRRRGQDAEIAAHFLQADDREQALRWTVRDGDAAAAVFAYGDAEARYQFATKLAGELGDDRTEAEAAEKLGDVLYRVGRYGDAIESLERAGGIYERVGDHELYLTVVARCADAYQFGGRIAEGIERVLPVVRALEAAGTDHELSPGAADVYAALCGIYLSAGSVQEALATAETAVSVGERTGNMRALCVSEICRGIALGVFNRHTEQRQAFEHATRTAVPIGDPWMLATALLHEASSYLAANDLAEGERLTRCALDVAENAELSAGSSFIRSRLADVLVTHGRWAEPRPGAKRAEAERRSLPLGIGHTFLFGTLGRIVLLQGDRDDGLRCLREALAVSTNLQYPPGIAHASESSAWQ